MLLMVIYVYGHRNASSIATVTTVTVVKIL